MQIKYGMHPDFIMMNLDEKELTIAGEALNDVQLQTSWILSKMQHALQKMLQKIWISSNLESHCPESLRLYLG